MITFKKIDWMIQVFLIIAALVMVIASRQTRDLYFLYYFVVGGWQLISVFVHLANKIEYKSRLRKIYLQILAVVTVLAIISFALYYIIIYYLIALLFFSPAMATLYLITSIIETKNMTTQVVH
ncbi:MAG: hypothetical protein H7122_16760 [Chitinophagaceae bacterium]|nr:hypothetical protein [Chitinophagaceae bacterium]